MRDAIDELYEQTNQVNLAKWAIQLFSYDNSKLICNFIQTKVSSNSFANRHR
jgi:hypothetical protein